jgi:hypothetical protein
MWGTSIEQVHILQLSFTIGVHVKPGSFCFDALLNDMVDLSGLIGFSEPNGLLQLLFNFHFDTGLGIMYGKITCDHLVSGKEYGGEVISFSGYDDH